MSVRATYTPKELTLSRITDHLFEFGFKRVSLSPATEFKEKKFSLKREHISVIKDEERKIAEDFLKKVKERDYRGLSLFDYQLSQMYHRRKRIYPCGGGKNYFGVSPEGNIYLCHRFVGMEEFKMGNVFTGLDKSLQKEILAKHVDERKICKSCWARYLCGGGCYYHALAANGNIFTPDPIMCVLTKHSLEVSMWIYAQIHDEDKDILRNIYENLSEPYRDGSASGIIEKDERKEKG